MRNPDQYQQFRFYDQHRASDGTIIAGRLGLHADALANGLPGASVTILPRLRTKRKSLLSRWGARRQVASAPGYGWSERPDVECDECQLVLNLEQAPERENRLLLDHRADRHGVPRPLLQRRWTATDQERLDRLRRALGEWCDEAKLGRLSYQAGAPPDLNAHHHAGTTRMHEDPRGGVVDPDLKVHGIDNLFVAGASVFPAAGWANPTLTIAALSLKLADHLRPLL
jgi:choline dehydrogenase-like flavoprotein